MSALSFGRFCWTPENERQLADLWFQGRSAAQIAIEINCPSRNAVIGKVSRLGLMRGELVRQPPAAPRRIVAPDPAAAPRRIVAPAPAPAAVIVLAPPAPPRIPHMRRAGVLCADLEARDCRYVVRAGPVGRGDQSQYCADEARPDSAYCEAHHAACYTRAPAPSQPRRRPA